MTKVVVVGATGNQGGAGADRLLERGHEVVAYVRSQESPAVKALRARGARLATGDLSDPDALRHACTGADAVSACRCRSARAARTRMSRRDACLSTPPRASTSTWGTSGLGAVTGWWPPPSTTPTDRPWCTQRSLARTGASSYGPSSSGVLRTESVDASRDRVGGGRDALGDGTTAPDGHFGGPICLDLIVELGACHALRVGRRQVADGEAVQSVTDRGALRALRKSAAGGVQGAGDSGRLICSRPF
ncbi:SDR family oxidoreductase [Nonomuraea dietziae]|uniref:SDR family oxidoreductase n=1 Tax=Nonomuraea dietziae TaxID=65515 RepID=UPI003406D52B